MTALASILTTFFDSADNAYLPTIVEREQLVDGERRAGGERVRRRVHGLRDQRLPRPAPDRADRHRGRCRHVPGLGRPARARSAREEAPPPPREDREPVLAEIRDGLRLVRHDPVLRAFVGAQMALSALWGIFGATWFLFVLEELGIGPARSASSPGSAASRRSSARSSRRARRGGWGIGPVAIVAMLLPAVGQRVHPAGARRAAAARRSAASSMPAARRRLGGDRLRHHRGVGPPDAGPRPGARDGCRRHSTSRRASPSWSATLGCRGARRGDRAARDGMALAPLGGLVGAAILWFSPVRHLLVLPATAEGGYAGRSGRDRGRRRDGAAARGVSGASAVRRTAPRRRRRGRTG